MLINCRFAVFTSLVNLMWVCGSMIMGIDPVLLRRPTNKPTFACVMQLQSSQLFESLYVLCSELHAATPWGPPPPTRRSRHEVGADIVVATPAKAVSHITAKVRPVCLCVCVSACVCVLLVWELDMQ